jgi:hypothetical protein
VSKTQRAKCKEGAEDIEIEIEATMVLVKSSLSPAAVVLFPVGTSTGTASPSKSVSGGPIRPSKDIEIEIEATRVLVKSSQAQRRWS